MQLRDQVIDVVCHLTLRVLAHREGIVEELCNGGAEQKGVSGSGSAAKYLNSPNGCMAQCVSLSS